MKGNDSISEDLALGNCPFLDGEPQTQYSLLLVSDPVLPYHDDLKTEYYTYYNLAARWDSHLPL